MKVIAPIIFLLSILSIASCKRDKNPEDTTNNIEEPNCVGITVDANSQIMGYSILEKVPGIWNGPVTSSTALGSYPEWIVDFRPISPSQISAKNELDSVNDIFMSFFVIKDGCEFKMAFRNGGGFAGNVRNSYMFIDSVFEDASHSFYRFSDPVAGGNRVYTDIKFVQDSMIMHTFTNQYNNLSQPVSHMLWKSKLVYSIATQDALTNFNFPQKQLTKDFSSTFTDLTEAVFYSASQDPYPENQQPYLGNTQVNINITNPTTIDPSKKVMIILTTEPLFNGFTFLTANLATRSRYVFVGAEQPTGYNFNYMHPGDYYVNAVYDVNGDYNFTSGDYMNGTFDIPVTLGSSGNASATVNINFQIP